LLFGTTALAMADATMPLTECSAIVSADVNISDALFVDGSIAFVRAFSAESFPRFSCGAAREDDSKTRPTLFDTKSPNPRGEVGARLKRAPAATVKKSNKKFMVVSEMVSISSSSPALPTPPC